MGYQQPDQVNFFKYHTERKSVHSHGAAYVYKLLLTRRDKAEYAAYVFSYLHGKNILWDEYSKLPFLENNNNAYNSPLYYILQQPSLKYAWWMLLVTVLLYVCFAARRTQRIIPVLEVKTNTSLEYINMISALHYPEWKSFRHGAEKDEVLSIILYVPGMASMRRLSTMK